MKVKVMNRLYQMNQKEYQGLLQVASEQVPFGIYAIEKQQYAELRCDKCSSVTQLKDLTRQFKAQGFRVYANNGVLLETAGASAAEGALMGAT
nr:MAG TPA: putative zinc-ribbon domain protein [Caudoviricetes sp.]